MQLKDLLNEYKCRMSVTNDYIAEHVGVNKSTVSRWMKGETKVMKPAVIEKLSYLLGTDVESLLKNSDRFEKPLLGTAKAGYGLFAEENLAGYEEVSKSDYYRGDYFLRVCGDSMTGAHIHDQDLIYVKQCDDVKKWYYRCYPDWKYRGDRKTHYKKRTFPHSGGSQSHSACPLLYAGGSERSPCKNYWKSSLQPL